MNFILSPGALAADKLMLDTESQWLCKTRAIQGHNPVCRIPKKQAELFKKNGDPAGCLFGVQDGEIFKLIESCDGALVMRSAINMRLEQAKG